MRWKVAETLILNTDLDNYNNIPVVWHLSALHFDSKMLLSGVILSNNRITFDRPKGMFRNFLLVCKSYFIGVYANKEISITINDKTINTSTDKYGSFKVLIDIQHKVEVVIKTSDNEKPLQVPQNYPIFFQDTKSPFDVISDIDDTIIVSYTADFFKRIGAIAFTRVSLAPVSQVVQPRLE